MVIIGVGKLVEKSIICIIFVSFYNSFNITGNFCVAYENKRIQDYIIITIIFDYHFQMLYTCLKGRKVDKGDLVRIMISSTGVDLDEIELVFKNKYDLELKDAICESITQSDYREFIVMLTTKPSKRARLGSL